MCALNVRSTLMEADDVRVSQGGRDLNLSLDVNPVQVFGDALLTDGLDGHLTEKTQYGESVRQDPNLDKDRFCFSFMFFLN